MRYMYIYIYMIYGICIYIYIYIYIYMLYGCETCVLNVRDRKRMEAVEMNCLRNICELRRIDRVPNEIRRMCGKNVSVSQRMDQGVLRWFGHVERMGNKRLVKRVYDSEASEPGACCPWSYGSAR